MDPQTWQKIQDIMDEALALEASLQEAYVERKCAGDKELLYEVASLLKAEAQSEKLFEQVALPEETQITRTIGGLRQFDHYTIVSKIDVGGMGIVYKALDNRLDRQVAIKFLSPQFCQNDSLRQRFLTEARIISKIDHPNICLIFDVGESDDNALYLVMPFYDGSTLREHIKQQPLAFSQVISIAIQVCEGLAAAHAQEIIHRDIKPANVMLTSNGVAKILDFGIAKMTGEDNTQAGEALGTVAYMSPEQLTGKPVTHRADIWSMGVMLHELVTSVRPYTAKNSFELAHIILSKPRQALSDLIENPPRQLQTILDKSLAVEPEQRYESIIEMRDALKALSLESDDNLEFTRTHTLLETKGPEHTGQSHSHITDDTRELIRHELAKFVGPLAKVLVKEASCKTDNVKRLCEVLADSISEPDDRSSFLAHIDQWSLSAYAQASFATNPMAVNAGQTLPNQQALDSIETEMTKIIGPIAGTLLKRALANSQSAEQLTDNISRCFEDGTERQQFMQTIARWL